jgi:hypothetical protein
MTELFDQVSIEDPDPRSSATIRINPPMGDRRVHAFARLAAVVDRAGATEIPSTDEQWSSAGIQVHARPPEPRGPGGRLREEAMALLERAEADHVAALEHSRTCWEGVHDREQQIAHMAEEEAAALRAFELLRDARRNAERALRQARSDGEDASRRCLITSRVLDGARMRADRL